MQMKILGMTCRVEIIVISIIFDDKKTSCSTVHLSFRKRMRMGVIPIKNNEREHVIHSTKNTEN